MEYEEKEREETPNPWNSLSRREKDLLCSTKKLEESLAKINLRRKKKNKAEILHIHLPLNLQSKIENDDDEFNQNLIGYNKKRADRHAEKKKKIALQRKIKDKSKKDRKDQRRRTSTSAFHEPTMSDMDYWSKVAKGVARTENSKLNRKPNTYNIRAKMQRKERARKKEAARQFREAAQLKKQQKRAAKKNRQLARKLESAEIVTESHYIELSMYDGMKYILTDILKPFEGLGAGNLPVSLKVYTESFDTLITFFYQLYKSRDVGDYLAAVNQCFNALQISKSDVALIAVDIYNKCKSIVTEAKLADTFENAVTFVKLTLNSEVIANVWSLFLRAVSLQWFSKDLTSFVKQYVRTPKKQDILTVFSLCAESVSVLLRAADRFWMGDEITDILFSSDPVKELFNEWNTLKMYEFATYTSLPIEGYMCAREHSLRLEKLKKNIEIILQNLSSFDKRKKSLALVGQEAGIMLGELQMQRGRFKRPEPVGIVIHGVPGIGKSKILQEVAHLWSQVKGRVFEPNHMFSKPTSQEYYDGYTLQPIIHFSELGNLNKQQVVANGDTNLSELLSLVDTLPLALPMADVKLKGKVFASPELVLVDTNNPTLNIQHLMHAPGANYRRFVFIKVEVLPEFRLEGGQLDVAASLNATSDIMDRYEFTMYNYKLRGNTVDERHVIFKGRYFAWKDFLINDYFVARISKQTAINDRFADRSTVREEHHDEKRGAEQDNVHNAHLNACIVDDSKVDVVAESRVWNSVLSIPFAWRSWFEAPKAFTMWFFLYFMCKENYRLSAIWCVLGVAIGLYPYAASVLVIPLVVAAAYAYTTGSFMSRMLWWFVMSGAELRRKRTQAWNRFTYLLSGDYAQFRNSSPYIIGVSAVLLSFVAMIKW